MIIIALKPIQTSFTCTNRALISATKVNKAKNRILCLSKSNNSESEASPPPEGDTRQQDLLVRIAMLQAQKVRLTDFLDERSAYLTKFGEEVNAEFDKIGEDAMKGLDEASSRIMEKIEGQMQAFEESEELNREDIETTANMIAEFEEQFEESRNEGLFFKSLKQSAPVDKAKAMEETQKIKDVTKTSAGSKTRRNIYLALICILALGIADSFITSPDWKKVAVLGAILVALLTQFSYEQQLLSETERKEHERTDKEKQ